MVEKIYKKEDYDKILSTFTLKINEIEEVNFKNN